MASVKFGWANNGLLIRPQLVQFQSHPQIEFCLMIKGYATVIYDPERPGLKNRAQGWAVADVDKEITRYFRWWIDKNITNPLGLNIQGSLKKYPFINLCHPSWNAHISIVRGEKNRISPDKKHLWGKYQNQIFEFQYDLNPHQILEKPDFWVVEVHAPELLNIRKELGLITTWPLHLTVGRTYFFNSKDEYD